MKTFKCWMPDDGETEEDETSVELYNWDDAEDAATHFFEKRNHNAGNDYLRDCPDGTFSVAVRDEAGQLFLFDVRPEYDVSFRATLRSVQGSRPSDDS